MLKYARLLIDIQLNADLPEFIDFINDQDVVVRVPVSYEWKPLECTHCHMFGHLRDRLQEEASAQTSMEASPAPCPFALTCATHGWEGGWFYPCNSKSIS